MHYFLFFLGLFTAGISTAYGNQADSALALDLTGSKLGYVCLGIFSLAYIAVILEEYTQMRKSKPVLLAAGLIWALIAFAYGQNGYSEVVENAARHNLLEYSELMLFLLVAMTYVNAMEERNVFEALKSWLTRKGFSLRQIFWMTGMLSFLISPVADNLTTALIMCAVIMAVGGHSKRFIAAGCTNIVIAANAGGAFSPFGDITTLMVWQKGVIEFTEFFSLFFPSLINWLIPAVFIAIGVPKRSTMQSQGVVVMKRGAVGVIVFFLLTIVTAVVFHNNLHLPPVMGMFTGLAYLQLYGYYLKKTYNQAYLANKYHMDIMEVKRNARLGSMVPFDVFKGVARSEWDTLLFFYGVVLCVGGLSLLGYLSLTSDLLYTQLGPTIANSMVGVLSAIVDNIPVMFAVLTMNPDMSHGQWLLVTLTAGVGGSLLSVGSAAGVALMGQSKGLYTFMGHLKWTPVIALGYAGSILLHLFINQSVM